MKIGKYLLALLLVFSFTAMAYGAPVGLISESDITKSELWPEKDFGLSLGLITDVVDKRKIDIDSGSFSMTALMARIGVTALAFENVNLYIDLGQTLDMEYKYLIRGLSYTSELKDAFIYGLGFNALINKWDNGLEIGVNASYRRSVMELDTTTIDSITYKRGDLSSLEDGDFVEYQGALEAAWKMGSFIPYVGVKYSEVEVDAIFTVLGERRDATGKNAGENFGAFVGFTFAPGLSGSQQPVIDQYTINVEGRFIDEEAINVGISYKF